MAGAIGIIGPALSVGSSLLGLASGTPSQNVPAPPPVYQFQGMPQADIGATTGIQGVEGLNPQIAQTLNYLYGTPGAAGATAGADIAGRLGAGAGLTQYGQGMGLVGQGQSLAPYAQQLMQMGLDPQGDLYNRLFQQQTDQTRAALEARGIAMTPYGAGVEAQSDIGFNTAWQQNLLNRALQGAGGAAGLYGQGAQEIGQGVGMMAQAPGTYYQGAMYPYQTGQTIGQGQFGALGQAQNLMQAPIGDWLAYLQAGTGAAGAGTQRFGTQLQQANQQFQQQQQLGQNLGAGLQGLAKGFGGMGGGGGTGGFATNAWGQANPGVAGSAYYGPVQ